MCKKPDRMCVCVHYFAFGLFNTTCLSHIQGVTGGMCETLGECSLC